MIIYKERCDCNGPSMQWSCEEWSDIYHDLPSRYLKVKVKNRMVVKTTDFERRCESPRGLQELIDQLVGNAHHGRAFIR